MCAVIIYHIFPLFFLTFIKVPDVISLCIPMATELQSRELVPHALD